MEFREARSLAVLSKLESIAKTAQQVNLTPAAVHKQIKNLESEFGVCLYEKTGRTVHLTQAARVIMPYLEELLAQYEAITAALTEWKGLRRGFVRIGANPAVSSLLLPPLLNIFRRQWPGVTAILDVDNSALLMQRVANRSLDLALGLWSDSSRERLTWQARWEYDVVPFVSAKVSRCTSLKDLASIPFIRLPQGNVLASWIDDYLDKYEFRPAEVMVVNNAHTMIALVCEGLGFAMLPMWAIASEVREGRVAAVTAKVPALKGSLGLITPKSGYIPPPVKAFIDVARENCSWDYLSLAEEGSPHGRTVQASR